MNRRPFDAAEVGHQSPLAHVDLSLTSAVVDRVVNLAGDFVYIDQASTGVVSIELNLRQAGANEPILLAAGGSIEVPGGFASLKINATAQLNKTVRIVVGNGVRIKSGGTVNASSNVLSVVDGGKQRTADNKAFLGAAYYGPLAANFTHIELWNSLTSGVNAFIQSIVFSSTVNGKVYFREHTAALAVGYANSRSKKLGANVGLAIQVENNATYLGNGQPLLVMDTLAGHRTQLEFSDPIMLSPGNGLIVHHGALNCDLSATFDFFIE